jgi:serine/threonine protein kinase
MSLKPLYEFDEELRKSILELHFEARFGAKIVGKSEGAMGEVFRLDLGNTYPRYLAAKCPKFVKFGNQQKASLALESFLHEVEKTYRLLICPWVNRINDIEFVQGWPFLISRWNDGTLADLIGNPLAWRDVDRIASLIQIVRALRTANERGISAHQDLKPENIFITDLHRKFPDAKGSIGLHFQMLVGDFGNADAFRDFGRNSGTRPYMAPEQFQGMPLDPSGGAAIDVFAIGVIAHEMFCDGLHPIGKFTASVWPQKDGVTKKWGEEKVWRRWAETNPKELSTLQKSCPNSLFPTVASALSSYPESRPGLEEFESSLWQTLSVIDLRVSEYMRLQIEQMESLYTSDTWPHFEERLALLRQIYAERS